MAKLHELLAIAGDIEGAYKKILEETHNTFTKKPAYFMGQERRLENFDENEPDAPVERLELTTTVSDKLKYQAGHIIRHLDAELQREKTNQVAKADLEVDGKTIASDVPVTYLLGMESRLKQIRSVYEAIPTLPPGVKWELDVNIGENVFRRTKPEEKFKTAKTFKHKVLVDAQFPKEGEGGTSLPAQIEKWEENVNVGKYVTEQWSGMLSPAEKTAILGRIDNLMRAVKKARQRGNSTEVVKSKIGRSLMDYIHEG